MLIENTKSQTRTIGELLLIPGVNKVTDSKWDEMVASKKWSKPIKGLIEDGILEVKDARQKLTIALVNKTYDVEVLREWQETAKGTILGAIRKQLEALEIEKDM